MSIHLVVCPMVKDHIRPPQYDGHSLWDAYQTRCWLWLINLASNALGLTFLTFLRRVNCKEWHMLCAEFLGF